MRSWHLVTSIAFFAWGCGGGDGEGGNGNGHHDGGNDAAMDAPADAPVEPDAAPPPCHECDSALGAGFGLPPICHPNQEAEAGCAYDDFSPGDLCDIAASPAQCQCVAFGTDDIGFCTLPCANNGDCLPHGAFCVNFGPPTGALCVWFCNEDSECPPGMLPLPDLGPLDGPADMGPQPEPPPDMGPPEPLPDGAEPPPDMPPPQCFASCDGVVGITGLACRADQSVGAGCAYGTGAPGDTCLGSGPGFCTSGVCFLIGTDTVGFCTEPCVTAGDCSHPAECLEAGAIDYCVYTCTVPSDCPP
jgi:hypothetical protein